jgi:uncharacterized protein YjbJ (UPF0337 family)
VRRHESGRSSGHLILRRTDVRIEHFGQPRVTLLIPISRGGLFVKDQVQGKAEEIKGKVTGNRTEETKGKLRQQVGKAKSTVRDIKGDVGEARQNA